MKNKTLWIAGILTLTGIILCIAAASIAGFDRNRMSTASFVTKTQSVDWEFSSIVVEAEEADVRLLPAEDGECRVVCLESENGSITYTVSVSGGVLTVRMNDSRRWYEYTDFFIGNTSVDLYLPESSYDNLTVSTTGGSIHVPDAFSFDNVQVESSSGSVRFSAGAGETLTLRTAGGNITVSGTSPKSMSVCSNSGNINMEGVDIEGAFIGETDSGSLSLTDVTSGTLTVKTDSGEIILNDVVVSETLCARSQSGNVKMNRCDGGDLNIRTSGGNVSGTLLSDKVFITDTSSGRVNVPHTATGGVCEIKTNSGNIDISIG